MIGTFQTPFIAFCIAVTTAVPAHNAVRMPTISATPLPWSEPLRSSVPMMGNWVRTDRVAWLSDPRTKPRTVTNTRSSGNTEKKP